MALCEKYIDSRSVADRALEICEEACMLRWESVTEIYRAHVLKEERLLPPGMAA